LRLFPLRATASTNLFSSLCFSWSSPCTKFSEPLRTTCVTPRKIYRPLHASLPSPSGTFFSVPASQDPFPTSLSAQSEDRTTPSRLVRPFFRFWTPLLVFFLPLRRDTSWQFRSSSALYSFFFFEGAVPVHRTARKYPSFLRPFSSFSFFFSLYFSSPSLFVFFFFLP